MAPLKRTSCCATLLRALVNNTPSCRRYDPYGRVLTREEYDQAGMRAVRRRAIERARTCSRWGLVMGTLGRQGNPALLRRLQTLLEQRDVEYSLVLLSEVTPDKLAAMPDVEAWVQVACPRCGHPGIMADVHAHVGDDVHAHVGDVSIPSCSPRLYLLRHRQD